MKNAVLLFLLLLVGSPWAAGFGVPITFDNSPSKPADSRFLIKVTADFDGDYQTDIASGTHDGQTDRVEIRFSTRRSPASVVFPASSLGLNFFASDIDGDRDQDLVIASAASPSPLAVWLNDDAGHFENGSRWWWVTLLTNNDSPDFDSNNSRNDPASISQNQHSLFQSSAAPQVATLEVHDTLPQEWQNTFTRILPSGFSTRGPPVNSVPQANSHN